MSEIVIREELPADAESVRQINLQAFETTVEADIVDQLRESCVERISLVALLDGEVVGHILFTPVTAQSENHEIKGMGLAPMAVSKRHQQQGIGSAMMHRGLEMVKEAGYPFVIVLGHPNYYPRFGFERASKYGLRSEFDEVPDEAFMIMVFDVDTVKSVSGVVKYRPEFADAG